MSRFINSVTKDVIDVPDVLDAMYETRPEFGRYDDTPGAYPEVPASVTAPAGATGDPVPTFDPDQPLAAGPVLALAHIEDIKGVALDESLVLLDLDTSGKADEKRDRLAERLNKEVSGG